MTDGRIGSGRQGSGDWFHRIGFLVVVGLAVAMAFLLPSLLEWVWSLILLYIPLRFSIFLIQSRWLWVGLILAVAFQILATRRANQGLAKPLPGRLVDGILRFGLPMALGISVFLMLASWLPHYLRWPWWADSGHFGLSALSWERGVLPYRDLYDFNFPGPMYVDWCLGKVFGWGRTVPLYAFDAILLLGFGLATISWGRERFGTTVPGLVTLVASLAYYCSLDHSLVAQRDWQVPLFATTGLMALESWPGRRGRYVSAALFALAFSFRPHVVVFVPAFLAALDENARKTGQSFGLTLRAVAEWSALAGVGCLLAFFPLLVTGTLDDFLRNFQEALEGGGYHEVGKRSLLKDVTDQLNAWENWMPLVVLFGVASLGRGAQRRTVVTWLVAFAFVLIYKPLSPVAHGYLGHPLVVVRAIALGVLSGATLRADWLRPVVKVIVILAIILEAVPGIPVNCRPDRVAESVRCLWWGEDSASVPPGCERAFSPAATHPYHWDDYQAVLKHLRTKTGPRTKVVNFLRSYPFPMLNAPVGRLTAYPSVAGILWLRWVDPGLEPEFARAIEAEWDAVVVWMPGVPADHARLKLPLIEATVRRCYAPEAKHGEFEIWRRRSDSKPRSH